MIEANWSGEWPCLCHGEWTLIMNGKDVSDKIPKNLRTSSMNTYGTYSSLHFENWQEVFEEYNDGLRCEEWIQENKAWLNEISEDLEIQREIYEVISKQDFREGSCGGCI